MRRFHMQTPLSIRATLLVSINLNEAYHQDSIHLIAKHFLLMFEECMSSLLDDFLIRSLSLLVIQIILQAHVFLVNHQKSNHLQEDNDCSLLTYILGLMNSCLVILQCTHIHSCPFLWYPLIYMKA